MYMHASIHTKIIEDISILPIFNQHENLPYPNPSFFCAQGSRGLKRKGVYSAPISELPKLFSSNFKVPKLKRHANENITPFPQL